MADSRTPGFFRALFMLALTLVSLSLFAESNPVGLWQTVDEDSGAPKSLVRIYESRGVLEGRIVKIIDPLEPENAVCDLCTDDRRKQPIVGLKIIRNIASAYEKPGIWGGGDILDPENGKVYKLNLSLSGDGRRLEVRGYIGIPMLGRTQTWLRVD